MWEQIRQAIATKASNVAGIRQATAGRNDTRGPLPALKILPPTYRLNGQPNASVEDFTLTFPAELLIAQQAGKSRGDGDFLTIARALQVEWQSGVKLGIDGVSHSYIDTIEPDLNDYADTGLTGGQITFVVNVREILTTARSA